MRSHLGGLQRLAKPRLIYLQRLFALGPCRKFVIGHAKIPRLAYFVRTHVR